ncbi:MAG: UTP--glucose-1-phosphate uridylyltransferase [Clostridia bacterium]|nr:UTP--glucose-1-phosphate uridylyltransferase [Clostridia bacterium]
MQYAQWQEDKEQGFGHPGPKGTYKINFNNGEKYLFEIIVDTLKKANNKYNVNIPWYIMTSNENNDDTIKFLEDNNYFGYLKEYVYIFKQGELPLLNEQGKVLIGKSGLIKEASNGNGGIFNSMLREGAIKDMDKRGIEWIFIGSVDNVLLKNVDVLLLGITALKGTKIGTRTVLKRNPEEKVGVLCKQNNKVKVIEYTELPKDIAGITNDNGELVFGESHIMCNLFNINAIKDLSTNQLEYHIAFKKSDYIDQNGKLINPDKPNVYKFEQFIFDSFKSFDDIAILRGKREEDFAPVKNAEGEDSPATAKKLYENYWKNRGNMI